ncbi:hypothetical protein [Microcoleus sp. F4-D5]
MVDRLTITYASAIALRHSELTNLYQFSKIVLQLVEVHLAIE